MRIAARGVLLLSIVALLMLVPAAVSAASPRLYTSNGAKYKPNSYRGFNHSRFTSLSWSKWNSKRAVARGTVHVQYPGGDPVVEEVRVTFSRARHVCGGWFYTSARWKVPGDTYTTMGTLMSSPCIWTGA